MRVLVTGADGFAGRHLMARLADGFEPVALRADLTDRDALDAEIAALRPDGCVHLASSPRCPRPRATRMPPGASIMRYAPNYLFSRDGLSHGPRWPWGAIVNVMRQTELQQSLMTGTYA